MEWLQKKNGRGAAGGSDADLAAENAKLREDIKILSASLKQLGSAMAASSKDDDLLDEDEEEDDDDVPDELPQEFQQ